MIRIDIYFIIGLIVLFFVYRSIRESISNYIIVNKHQSYVELYEWFLEKAYDIVYRTHVMVYSSEGLNPSAADIESAKRNFVKLTREMMGSTIEQELIQFFGSEQTLTENTILYFQEKTMADELLELIKQHKDLTGTGPTIEGE